MRAIPWKAALGNWVINWGIDMHPRVVERDDALRAASRRAAPLSLTRLIIQSRSIINYPKVAGIARGAERDTKHGARFETDVVAAGVARWRTPAERLPALTLAGLSGDFPAKVFLPEAITMTS